MAALEIGEEEKWRRKSNLKYHQSHASPAASSGWPNRGVLANELARLGRQALSSQAASDGSCWPGA